MEWSDVRAAVVGSGPSGFYLASMLLDKGASVDMYERLPVPFGLVRYGVAPDHQKIKSVTRVFEKVATGARFAFHGGVEIGIDLERDELARHFHITVYATGLEESASLGVPGESIRGSFGAADFVRWYNGHPDAAELDVGLGHDTAVVIGNGNVALDVARLLVLSRRELAASDAPEHVVDALDRSAISRVLVVGRRGPIEASFTTKELIDLGSLELASAQVADARDVSATPADAAGDARIVGNQQALASLTAQAKQSANPRKIEFWFRWSPVEVLGDENGEVSGIRLRSSKTGTDEIVRCGLVIRAIGYRARDPRGLTLHESGTRLANDGGRCIGEQGVRLGEYVVGWAKRGPSGVIGTNKQDAAATFQAIAADVEAGRVRSAGEPVPRQAPFTWADWRLIDSLELSRGIEGGRPRVKFVAKKQMESALLGHADTASRGRGGAGS
jgi:ferredoxin--NADP+ reductase